RVVAWDALDTPLRLDNVAEVLVDRLSWPDPDAEGDFEGWRRRWGSAFELRPREVVTTAKSLAERLAELERAIRGAIHEVLAIETDAGALTSIMNAFRETLAHDLDEDGFADTYAQTIAYGLLSARIADPTGQTADDLVLHMSQSPFLREL